VPERINENVTFLKSDIRKVKIRAERK
jgi:hypothetical protein